MTSMQQRGEALCSGKQSVLGHQADKSFQRFLSPFVVKPFACESKETIEHNGRNRVRARRRRILQRLAANIEPAHGRRISRAIEKSTAFGIAKALDGKLHRAFGSFEVTGIERCFKCVEQ